MNLQQIWESVDKNGAVSVVRPELGRCWNWIRGKTGAGYGCLEYEGKKWLSHRLIYVLVNGEIPQALPLDHLCFNRSCVNPQHLEAVTTAVNIQRGYDRKPKIAQCLRGHAYDVANTLILRNGRRSCRKCRVIRTREGLLRKKLQLNSTRGIA